MGTVRYLASGRPYPVCVAQESRSEVRVVVIELEEEGIKGTGRCTVSAYGKVMPR